VLTLTRRDAWGRKTFLHDERSTILTSDSLSSVFPPFPGSVVEDGDNTEGGYERRGKLAKVENGNRALGKHEERTH